jgi:hypothetical protein
MRMNLKLYLFVIHVVSNFIKLRVPNITSPLAFRSSPRWALKFKLHFQSLCDSFGLKRKPTSVKNPQVNTILERIHQTLANMMRTAELDMANTADPSNVADFLNDTAWVVRSTYHTVLKASPQVPSLTAQIHMYFGDVTWEQSHATTHIGQILLGVSHTHLDSAHTSALPTAQHW